MVCRRCQYQRRALVPGLEELWGALGLPTILCSQAIVVLLRRATPRMRAVSPMGDGSCPLHTGCDFIRDKVAGPAGDRLCCLAEIYSCFLRVGQSMSRSIAKVSLTPVSKLRRRDLQFLCV